MKVKILKSQAQDQVEELEGLDESADGSWGDYPIDTMLIRTESRTVHDVIRRIEKDMFEMNPDFQRDFIWDDRVQSKLIESVLMRIPLPVFYLAEDKKGKMIVVDGLQRLSTFKRFVNDELALKLPESNELNGKTFTELTPKLQNRIEDCNLILYIIDSKVPERARLDIFDRVNGGVPLTRQQMRNSLYMGKATRFLKAEASTDLFRKATGNSLDSRTMRDREFVNRFCAFTLVSLDNYKGDMDEHLAAGLINLNMRTEVFVESLSQKFRRSLTNNFKVFGKHAFRKHTSPDDSRSLINASLWDTMIVGLARYSESVVEAKAEKLRQAFYGLIEDSTFKSSITYSTNDVKKVLTRFNMTSEMLREIFSVNAT